MSCQGDAGLLARARPAGRRLTVRFLGKQGDPLLWAADVVAGAAFQDVARGVPEYLEALGPVRRIDA